MLQLLRNFYSQQKPCLCDMTFTIFAASSSTANSLLSILSEDLTLFNLILPSTYFKMSYYKLQVSKSKELFREMCELCNSLLKLCNSTFFMGGHLCSRKNFDTAPRMHNIFIFNTYSNSLILIHLHKR